MRARRFAHRGARGEGIVTQRCWRFAHRPVPYCARCGGAANARPGADRGCRASRIRRLPTSAHRAIAFRALPAMARWRPEGLRYIIRPGRSGLRGAGTLGWVVSVFHTQRKKTKAHRQEGPPAGGGPAACATQSKMEARATADRFRPPPHETEHCARDAPRPATPGAHRRGRASRNSLLRAGRGELADRRWRAAGAAWRRARHT